MTGDANQLRSIAIRNLQTLGLSEYAARTLAALTEIGGGSAREVSESSSVPRTRVYDAVEELSRRGFVEVRETHPKTFSPVTPGRIRRTFYREYVYKQVLVEWGLRALGSDETTLPNGVGVEVGSGAVDERLRATIEDAREHVTFVSIDGSPSDGVLSAMDVATTRNVAVRIVLVGDADPDVVAEAAPDATVLSVPNATLEPDGRRRFLLVDESLAVLGSRGSDGGKQPEIALYSDHVGADVGTLLRRIVDSWLADAD